MDDWRKSSRGAHDGACLEWRKSSHSAYNGSCVEAAACSCAGPAILVSDSRLGDASPVLRFSPRAWAAFTAVLR